MLNQYIKKFGIKMSIFKFNNKNSIFVAMVDIILVIIAVYISALLRFDFYIPKIYKLQVINTLPVFIITIIALNIIFGLYNVVWKYASLELIPQIFFSSFTSSIFVYIVSKSINQVHPHCFIESRSIFLIFSLINICCLGTFRIILRILGTGVHNKLFYKTNKKRIMVIGAGWAGASTIRDLKAGRHGNCSVIIVVDDDVDRIGTYLHRVPIVGGTDRIKYLVNKYNIDEIIIAIATPKGKIGDLVSHCIDTGCKVRRVTNIVDINTKSGNTLSVVKDIDLNDLLGRDEESIDLEPVKDFFKGRVILITGGGGSIGSELCRQIVQFNVKQIILFDISENYIYDLKSELVIKYGEKINDLIKLCVGSVRDVDRLEEVFLNFNPDIVIHAAAHKHVPLMEDCPKQAVLNNIFGTYNTAIISKKYNVKSFVLLSTDKAVNPTNIMGATKRVCEIIIQGLAKDSATKFAMVRFGNVLGSHGSVVPLFEKQIRHGGPVTVTNPDVIRFFMSIQEASKLVLQAASISKGGEVYVLDMGDPVKILDLAERMVKLYSDPYKEPVQIKIVGMRKGEKIREEILTDDENLSSTNIKKILISKNDNVDINTVNDIIDKLKIAIEHNMDMRICLKEIVPSFKEPDFVNNNFSDAELKKYRQYS